MYLPEPHIKSGQTGVIMLSAGAVFLRNAGLPDMCRVPYDVVLVLWR